MRMTLGSPLAAQTFSSRHRTTLIAIVHELTSPTRRLDMTTTKEKRSVYTAGTRPRRRRRDVSPKPALHDYKYSMSAADRRRDGPVRRLALGPRQFYVVSVVGGAVTAMHRQRDAGRRHLGSCYLAGTRFPAASLQIAPQLGGITWSPCLDVSVGAGGRYTHDAVARCPLQRPAVSRTLKARTLSVVTVLEEE